MITWVDWGIWIVYFGVIYTALWFYRQSKKDDDTYKWFLKGFLIKVFGGVSFAFVSIYYYGGDTMLYYQGSSVLAETLFTDPSVYFKLIFTPNNLPSEFSEIAHQISYSRTAEEWFMVRLLSFLNIISFNSYLVMTLMMSTIAFWGGWKLFRVFVDILPNSKKMSFIIVFLLPSILFWGTGILKDTVTLALFNYVLYELYLIFDKKQISIIKIFTILICSLIIYKLKSYILLAFLISVMYLIYLYSFKLIKLKIIKLVLAPMLLLSLSIIGAYFLINLSKNTVYSIDNIEQQITGFHTWHTTTGGSSYNLGSIDYTPTGIIKKTPAALNVTFFRPYLWEARNLTSLIGAIESSFVLIFFIMILFKTKLRFISVLKQNRFLLGLSAFVIVFGFAIGFTSYNFGALARYKMPVYSIFVFILFFIYIKSNNVNKANSRKSNN